MADIEAMAARIAEALFAKMKDALVKRDARIDAIEAMVANLPAPRNGTDGKDAEPINYDRIGEILRAQVRSAVEQLPIPKNGTDGTDGKDAEPINYERIDDMLRVHVGSAIDQLPSPKNGADGADGKDAEPIDYNLIDKTMRDYIALAIPKAEDLRSFVVAEVGKAVAEIPEPRNGLNGIDGEAGQNGQDGDPGPAGRDAIEIEILGEIDPARSYSRGTYAKHDNGLWRSFANTDGMKGWECLVAGVASMAIESAHEREFTIKSVLSDGTETQETFSLPVMIYRGGLVEGKEYQPGDVVTWSGHTWHCNVSTDEKPLDGGKAWTMCVRRGRDGKEGPPGPRH